MPAWRTGSAGGFNGPNGDDGWNGITGNTNNHATDETVVQARMYEAYTFSDLRCNVTISSATTTCTLRDDETDTSVSFATSSTGWVEDLTDSATIASGSDMSQIGRAHV